MKYDIFKSKHQVVMSHKKSVKALKSQYGYIPNAEQLINIDSHLSNQFEDVLAINTNAEELFWERTGRKLVFVNKDVIQMLSRAKFSGHSDAKILPPSGFETFALCFEKDTYIEFNGEKVKLYPCQITVMMADEMYKQVHRPFEDLTGLTILPNDELQLSITVSYKRDDATYRSCVDISEVMAKVNTEIRPTEERSLLFDHKLNDSEQITTNALMKIAVQLLIFNAATENKYLTAGYPEKCAFRVPGKETRANWKASYFNYTPSTPSNGSTPFRVSPSHFRNLKHDKFYRGRYANWVKGSRWVLVDEYSVGSNETYTQGKN